MKKLNKLPVFKESFAPPWLKPGYKTPKELTIKELDSTITTRKNFIKSLRESLSPNAAELIIKVENELESLEKRKLKLINSN